ncbi:MAG: ATP-binding protein [Microscillaceae bacterium]|nr:ATP-binding protein [Microscillaceae bacterium]
MIENPFADYGKIVIGDRFVGRKKEIELIQNRVFGESYGNIAIMGLPRIGKSSLAWNAIISYEEELENKNIYAIRINVGEFSEPSSFYQKIIRDVHRKFKAKNEAWIKDLHVIYEDLGAENLRISDRNSLIGEYFYVIQKNKSRVIYIFDEFDAVRNYLGVADFQFLRELSYNPQFKVCMVTVSRRTLKEIEPSGGTISNFYQTFTDLYLGMFSNTDLLDYWNTFFNHKIPINDEEKALIYEFTDSHPFLLDIFNYHLFNNLGDNLKRSIELTQKDIFLTFLNNYKTIYDLLEEEELGKKLLQMTIGPVYDISVTEAEKIERLGLVQIEDGYYKAFSKNFDVYLQKVHKEIPIWSLWSETEIKLREIVRIWLVEKFGENWVSKFRKLQNKETYIADLEAMQNREKQSFPETYSKDLLEYTYPGELFDKFMRVEWAWFKNIFGKEANEWKPKFDLLARIRNPLAHNKENILKDFERNDAMGYCQEIIHKIDAWIIQGNS